MVTSRYYIPLLLVFGFSSEVMLYMILIFPLHNSIERVREDKFQFSSVIRNFSLFNATTGRVYYYLVLILIFSVLYFLGFETSFTYFSLLTLFLFFRAFALTYSKRGYDD
ncbi:hypothetical protein TOL_2274 [Thalassolituus oleivorans MIL-1]|uniref:Uncharacterized protein n=1 Tax=Thalassolituus oleivorans MIL-1 TaxID=1298593 RepID=M5DRY0_9GAMM|nr:hypothetical protein TOL_2274 [Thalassolituus oleivorans MIL-1]